MRIAIWATGHEIADRVAWSVYRGMQHSHAANGWPKSASLLQTSDKISLKKLLEFDCHIAYGILRGAAEIFHACEQHNIPWFNLDRGYFGPGHYDGYYRISYKGTQAQYTEGDWPDSGITLKPFVRQNGPVLICPPTEYVKGFFNRIEDDAWVEAAIFECNKAGLHYKVRTKEMGATGAMEDVMASCMTYTFNCSLGWKGLIEGIPCQSDTIYSVVGSYYNTFLIDDLLSVVHTMPREPLLNFMRAHQFTLAEIEQGQAWSLIKHYVSSSVTIAEKPLPPMLQPIVSSDGLKNHFQSNS